MADSIPARTPYLPAAPAPRTNGSSPAPGTFTFPNFNMPGFPYSNFVTQLVNAPSNLPLTNGQGYGRWNSTTLNPREVWPSLFGSAPTNTSIQQPGQAMQPPPSQPLSAPAGGNPAPAPYTPPSPPTNFQGILGGAPAPIPAQPGAVTSGPGIAGVASAAAQLNPQQLALYASGYTHAGTMPQVWQQLGAQLAAQGMSNDQIAQVLNSYNPAAGANGGLLAPYMSMPGVPYHGS